MRTRLIYVYCPEESEAARIAEEFLDKMVYQTYVDTAEQGLIGSTPGGKLLVEPLRLCSDAKRAVGKEEAVRVEKELAELEAMLQALSDATLAELQTELRQEQAGAQPNRKKKLTRKQQKRKAAQRRKAEARAAAEAATAAAATETAEVMAAATAQLCIEEPEPMEREPEPEPEVPEECAICLNDLPVAGDDDEEEEDEGNSAVLLACLHTFHAACLARWKDKCLEKGLCFTCAMCRGAVVVVAAAAAEAK